MALPHPMWSDEELIPAIRAGNEAAFDALVREYYSGLSLFAAHILGSDAMAEEVVQDVLLRIWQQHDQLEIIGRLAPYLYTAVRNQALNYNRRQRFLRRWQQRVMAEPDFAEREAAAPEAEERLLSAELAEALERAVEELPPRCRQVFILRRQQQLSCAEVANIMQITPKTVEIQIGKALKLLRQKLMHLL